MSCPADPHLANLMAGSDLVLVATMRVPIDELMRQAGSDQPDYVTIPIEVVDGIKGRTDATAIRFYPEDSSYNPSNASVIELSDKPALLFLTEVSEGPVGLYFAGYTPRSLAAATPPATEAVETEARRQQAVLRNWRVSPSTPRYAEVKELIEQLGNVNADEQARIFQQLEALGPEAVPAIIAHMDDRRVLVDQHISLINHSPKAFEGIRHYGPELVVDALDAILNQITGQSFGNIHNGGSEAERASAVNGWRIYASRLACK